MPLCPSHVPLASPSCPAPRLVKVPGQCCLSIDCHKGSSVVPPVQRHPLPPAYPPFPFMPYPAYPYKPYSKPYHYKPKDTMGNELVEVEKKWDKLRGHKHLAGKRGRRDVALERRLFPPRSKTSCFSLLAPDSQTDPLCTPSLSPACVFVCVSV